MTDCPTQLTFDFHPRQAVVADFQGGLISSDAGLLPIRQLDERLGWSAAVAGILGDGRQGGKIDHDLPAIVRQRMFGLLAGNEDDLRYGLGHATKFGQVIAKTIGTGVGRASQDEIHAFAQRWDCVLEAPIAEGLRIWWFEKVFALARELNERRMKELRGGRTDPPNYRRIWMAEAKRCLQAIVTTGAQNCRPP